MNSHTPTRMPIRPSRTRPALAQVASAVALACAAAPAAAQTLTWAGSGTGNNWSEAANWVGGSTPLGSATLQLLFDNELRPTSFNDLASPLNLNRLTVAATSAARTFSGNALRFTGTDPRLSVAATAGFTDISNPLQLDGTLAVDGGPLFTAQLRLRGAISGTGGLRFESGVSNLNAANTYTGATVLASGAVVGVTGTAALGTTSGITVASGAELQLVDSGTGLNTRVGAPIALSGRLTSAVADGSIVRGSVTGVVTLTGAAEISSIGVGSVGASLNLTQAVQGGGQVLTLRHRGSGSSRLFLAGATNLAELQALTAGGSITVGGTVAAPVIRAQGPGGSLALTAVSGDGSLQVLGSQATVSGLVQGNRSIVVQGPGFVSAPSGSLALQNAANSFAAGATGVINLTDGGLLQATADGSLGAAANTLRMERSGSLLFLTATTSARAIHITDGTGFVNTAATTLGLSGPITGDGALALGSSVGNSVVTLSAANSFAGGLQLSGRTFVSYSNDAALGVTGGALSFNDGGLFFAAPTLALSRPITLQGTPAAGGGSLQSATASAVHVVDSAIGGTGALTLRGPGTIVLRGANSATGGLRVEAATAGQNSTLQVASDAALGAAGAPLRFGRQADAITVLPATLRAGASFDIDATRTTTFRRFTVDTNGFDVGMPQPLNGRDLTKAGAGTLRLAGSNSDSSGDNLVQVTGGRLLLASDQTLGTRARVTAMSAGTTLQLAGVAQRLSGLAGDTGSAVVLDAGAQLQLASGGNAGGTLLGSGTLLIGGPSSFGGVLRLTASDALAGFSGTVVADGSSSRLQAGSATALAVGAAPYAVVLRNGGGLDSGFGGGTAPVVLNLGAGAAVQLQGNGAQLVAGSRGLELQSPLVGSTGSGELRISGGTLPGPFVTQLYDVRLADAGSSFTGPVRVAGVAGLASDAALGDAGNALVLGDVAPSGTSALGALRAHGSFALGASRSLTLDGDSSFGADRSGAAIDTQGFVVTLPQALAQARPNLGLLKFGDGTLVLDGASSYTGATQVQAGTLAGNGGVAGSVAVSTGATLAPGGGASGTGIGDFAVGGGLALEAGSTLAFGLAGTGRGLDFDALDVLGNVTLSGAMLTVELIGGFQPAAADRFELIRAPSLAGTLANVASGGRLAFGDGSSFLVTYGGPGPSGSLWLSDYIAPIPEPGTWALLAAGLLAVGALARRPAATNPAA